MTHSIDFLSAGSSPVLVTERLRLRPWRPDDADAALALYGDPHVVRWLSPAMTVVNEPAIGPAPLSDSGTGRGLEGIRERMAALGGTATW